MSRDAKLIERIRARPSEATFRDVERVLEMFGWEQSRQRGSHVVFTKPGEGIITVPIVGGRKVKRRYLDMICERLGLDE